MRYQMLVNSHQLFFLEYGRFDQHVFLKTYMNKAKKANKVRRVDRRTNALPTNQQTDRQTDGQSQL